MISTCPKELAFALGLLVFLTDFLFTFATDLLSAVFLATSFFTFFLDFFSFLLSLLSLLSFLAVVVDSLSVFSDVSDSGSASATSSVYGSGSSFVALSCMSSS